MTLETREELLAEVSRLRLVEAEMANLRAAAEAAIQAKAGFLANISHELRTPLNAIIGYAEMLREEMAEDGFDSYLQDLTRILTAGRNLLGLINDVLDLSRIEAGRIELLLEEFDPAVLVEEITGAHRPLIEANKNLLAVDYEGARGKMKSDVGRVRQILSNLLSNAAKFTKEGSVSVKARRQTVNSIPFVDFEVTDTGIGISEEQLAILFHPFAQGNREIRKKYGGTGVGLILTHRICQILGGEISVESKVGAGTTFGVRLPAQFSGPGVVRTPSLHTIGSLAAVRPSGPDSAREPKPNSGLILVVDDDPVMRDLMVRHLGKDGFQVVTAWSGIEGLRLARILLPKCIILDVLMPQLDGWGVLSQIQRDQKLCSIPVIMTTVMDGRSHSLSVGAAAFVRKPVDWSELVKELRRLEAEGTNPGSHPANPVPA